MEVGMTLNVYRLDPSVREFWRRYVLLQGAREGVLGLVLSVLLAYYAGKAVWLARRITPGRPRATGQSS